MNILNEKDGGDTELLVYAMTLVNKVRQNPLHPLKNIIIEGHALLQSLNAVADQDTFYDVTDVLEEQGMEEVIKLHTDRKNGDIDLLEQFQIYEAVLRFEDGVGEESEQPAFDSLRSDTDRTEFLTESLHFMLFLVTFMYIHVFVVVGIL